MEAILPAVAEITVVYHNRQKASERQQIASSADAQSCLLNAFNPDTIALQETFVALYLNRANQVLGIYRVGVGGITGVVCDPRLILAVALKIGAVGIVLSHNHPSGTLRPSHADEAITTKLKEAARFMDIKVLDHLILSPDRETYYSFADDGLL